MGCSPEDSDPALVFMPSPIIVLSSYTLAQLETSVQLFRFLAVQCRYWSNEPCKCNMIMTTPFMFNRDVEFSVGFTKLQDLRERSINPYT